MSSSQFSVRIPPALDKQVKQFAKENNISKSKVMIDALKYYLGRVEGVSLNQELHDMKQKIVTIETIVKENKKNLRIVLAK